MKPISFPIHASNHRSKPSSRLAKRYGQEATIFAARNPLVSVSNVSGIDRWQLYSPQPFTSSEAENFTRKEKDSPSENANNAPWLNLTPISASKYSLSSRVQDLASRMIKVSGGPWYPRDDCLGFQSFGSGGWIARHKDGGPQEMFLPFRSMAIAMSGMRYMGSLPLRSLGINHLVASGDQAKFDSLVRSTAYGSTLSWRASDCIGCMGTHDSDRHDTNQIPVSNTASPSTNGPSSSKESMFVLLAGEWA